MALMVSGLFCVYLLQSTVICDSFTLSERARDVKNAAEVQLREEFAADGEPKLLEKEIRIFQERVSENGNELTNSSKASLNTTLGIINVTKEIIYTGLSNIQKDVDEVPEEVDNVRPTPEDWRKLNTSLEHLFNGSEDGLTIQNITNSFQNLSVNFLSSFQQEQSTKETHYQKQVQRPGLIGQLISGGTQQVVSNINNLDTRQNVISNFFNSFNRANSTTPQPSTTAAGFFQGAVSQFGNFVSNFRSSTTTTTTTTTTTPRTPLEVIQNFGNQIGNAIQTSIFGQRAPEQDEPSTQPPNLIQNVGQAIQNANPFRPQPTKTPPNSPNSSNPMEMFMCFNVGKMVSNLRQRH